MQEPVPRLSRDPEIIGNAQFRKYALDLKGPLDPQPADHVRPQAGNVATAKKDAPAGGTEHTRHEVEECRLPRAVRANDGMNPTAGKTNAEIVDRGQAAEPLGQILGSQDRFAHGSACSVSRDGADRAASRSPSRAIQPFQRPTVPFGAKITTRIAKSPTISE